MTTEKAADGPSEQASEQLFLSVIVALAANRDDGRRKLGLYRRVVQGDQILILAILSALQTAQSYVRTSKGSLFS